MVSGLARGLSWNFEQANWLMSRCQGAVVLALAKGKYIQQEETHLMTSNFCHLEGALATAYKVPTWILAEKGIHNSGILYYGGGIPINKIDVEQGENCLTTNQIKVQFQDWSDKVKSRLTVFLGYCSQAKSTADALHLFIEHTLGVKVRNYAMDFNAGSSILEEIERAAQDCACGIFLFTKDDPLAGLDNNQAAPRDNVVFEAGYFAHAKGKERTLIVREDGAKMPADLGGVIYLPLKDRKDISTIHFPLSNFLTKSV